MKKTVILFLCVILAAGMVFASGRGQQSSGVKTLSLTSWGPIEQSIFDNFTAKNPGIKIDFQQINDAAQYSQIVRTRLAGGDDIDMMGVRTEDFRDFHRQGFLADLTNLPIMNSFIPTTLTPITVNGRIYAIPTFIAAEAAWYNKDIFAKYNIQIPKTYDEFLAVCATLKRNGIPPQVSPLKDGWPSFEIALGPFQALVEKNPNIFADLETGKAKWTDPEFVDVFTKFKAFVDAGYVMEGSTGLDWQGAQQQWCKGAAAMYIDGSWNCGSIKEYGPTFNVGVFVVPQNGPGGTPAVSLLDGLWYSANAKGKNLSESLKFLEYFGDWNGGLSSYCISNGYIPSVKNVSVSDPLVNLWVPVISGKGFPSFRTQLLPGPTNALFSELMEVFSGVKTPAAACAAMQAEQNRANNF